LETVDKLFIVLDGRTVEMTLSWP